MGDPFRRLILDTVSVIIEKDPNGDTLVELLRVATPDLDDDGTLADSAKREKLFKTLKLRIHPDKHTGDMERATALYQDVQPFYDQCVANMNKRPSKQQPKTAAPPSKQPMRRNSNNGGGGGGSSRSMNGPASGPQHRRGNSSNANNVPTLRIEFEFDARKKWKFLDRAFDNPSFPIRGCSSDGLSALVAYQCINSRGAIAHGRKTERFYSQEQVLQKPASVHEKFSMRGGTKTLQSVDVAGIEAIKAEIVTRGPVVSTSFVLTEAFAKRPENRGALLLSQMTKCHPVLLIGWRVTNLGDMWLAQPLKRSPSDNKNTAICIPFGQFGIDTTVLAPMNSFEHVPWQNGPYFDHDMSAAPEWRSWPSLRMHLSSAELERFAECVSGGIDGGGLIGLHEKKSTFVVRHKEKFAQSRRCRLKEIRWDKKLGKWLISCAFV